MQIVAIRKLRQLQQYQTKRLKDKNIPRGKKRDFIIRKDKSHQGGQNNQKFLCFNNGS